MPLTGIAAKALKQVESGLCMLYGASYFTDEEWIKIDGLLHKGEYVFTDGPNPRNIMDEVEELMVFDEEKDVGATAESSAGSSSNNESAEEFKLEFSETTTPSGLATPIASIDPSRSVLTASAASFEPFQPSRALTASAPVSTPTAGSIVKPVERCNSVASVEAVVGRGKADIFVKPVEHTESVDEPAPPVTSAIPARPELEPTAEAFEPPKREVKPLPKQGGLALGYTQEQLDEMKAINAGYTKAGEIPKPRKSQRGGQQTRDGFQDHHEASVHHGSQDLSAAQPSNDWAMSVSATATEQKTRIQSWAFEVDAEDALSEKVTEVPFRHTRHECNNVIRRPESRLTNKYVIAPPLEQRRPANDAGFRVAQHNFKANSSIQLDIKAQDRIRVLKKVSGEFYWGENLRNGRKGQFPETVFVSGRLNRQQLDVMQQQVIPRQNVRAPSIGSLAHERQNAQDWEDDSESRVTPVKNSRFTVLEDEADRPAEQVVSLSISQLKEVVDQAVKDNIATPKQTCWFWKTNKGCRFAAHECRDAHFEMPNSVPLNLKNGKPTWAAKADLLNPPAPALPVPDLSYSASGHGVKTCWYWKNSTCTFRPEECTYLHAYSSSGVADRPHHSFQSQRERQKQISPERNWRQANDDVGEASVWGADEPEENENDDLPSPAGDAFDDWGISTYRKPNQEASVPSNGW